MATDRIQTGIRFPEILLRKITYIAKKDHRSLNAQLEHLAQECVDVYEQEHGEIILPEEEYPPRPMATKSRRAAALAAAR